MQQRNNAPGHQTSALLPFSLLLHSAPALCSPPRALLTDQASQGFFRAAAEDAAREGPRAVGRRNAASNGGQETTWTEQVL